MKSCVIIQVKDKEDHALCEHADRDFADHRLPVDVQFVFDDFVTNITINDFQRSIAAFISRGISFMLFPYGRFIIFRRSEAPVFDDVFDTGELEQEF